MHIIALICILEENERKKKKKKDLEKKAKIEQKLIPDHLPDKMR